MSLERTQALLGAEKTEKLAHARVAVVGLGGVGGYALEALGRNGVGCLIAVDGDTVSASNLNRQLLATHATVGLPKTEAARRRIAEISDTVETVCVQAFLTPDNLDLLFSQRPDVILDAIDTVTTKLALIERALKEGVAIVSALGSGNRLDPTRFVVGDLADTAGCGCGLARVLRHELRRRGITHLRVVYSTEQPVNVTLADENGRHPPASAGWTVGAAGLALAAEAVRLLTAAQPD